MRLLSEYEMGILQGDVKKISLPSTADFYVSLGLPQVFRRINNGVTEHFENSWLYCPMELIKTIRQNLIVAGNTPQLNYVSKRPIPVDDFNLFPILLQGKIIGFIADKEKNRLVLNRKESNILIDSLLSFRENLLKTDDNTVGEFISNLFQHDSTFENFMKRFLKLFTNQCHNSCGGFYYDDDGMYKLRMAVGGISRIDELPGRLNAETVCQWKESIRQKDYFTPAGVVPHHPVFLTTPPDFLFVHNGVKSEHTENIIALAVSGDIEYKNIERILELAELSSKLYETQFVKSTEILNLYTKLTSIKETSKSFDQILLDVFQLLKNQISISRLVFVDSSGVSRLVVNKPNIEPEVLQPVESVIDGSIFNLLKDEDTYFVPSIEKSKINERLVKQYYLHNVKSEICYSIKLQENTQGVIAVGAPVTGDYLLLLNEFLMHTAHFISHFCIYYHESQAHNQLVGVNERDMEHANTLKRFEMMGKLVGGYYHDIFSLMSVILGQCEIIEKDLKNEMNTSSVDKIIAGLQKINQAGDETTSFLNNLKEICSIGKSNFTDELSCKMFLKQLPSLIQGFSRQIKDTKNISLKIEVSTVSCIDFYYKLSEIYDHILPIILNLLEQAICSGVLLIKMENPQNNDILILEFNKNIIGHITIHELLQKTFIFYEICVGEKESGRINFGSIVLSYCLKDDELYRITIAKQSTLFTVESLSAKNCINQQTGKK